MRQVFQSAALNCEVPLGEPWQASRLPNSARNTRSIARWPITMTGSAQGM